MPGREIEPLQLTQDHDWYDRKGAAALLGLSVQTLNSYVRRGQFPAGDGYYQAGPVWHRQTLDAWDEAHASRPSRRRRTDEAKAARPVPIPVGFTPPRELPPEPAGRPKEQTETADDLRDLAGATRRAAALLDDLYARADKLSRPVHATGWTHPIAPLGGLGPRLREWADRLDTLAEETDPDG